MKYFAAILVYLCFCLTASAQNDCPEALVVCGDGDYIGLSALGPGTQELIGTNDCSSAENNSIWLELTIKTGGTLGFVLAPSIPDLVVDFDFFIYGPNVQCDSIGHAVRCSTTNPLMAGSDSNLTGMNDTETDIAEGPGPDGNNFINWFTVQAGEVYYLVVDRPVGFSDFSLHWTGTARFHPIPLFLNPGNIPIDLVKCDTDGLDDGVNRFDLATHAAMFIGNQENVVLTYHHNLDDVTNGFNPIDTTIPYVNTSNPEAIHMRMTNTVTGCFSIESFQLIVNPLPVFNNPSGIDIDITACDTDGINDGSFTFNLTQNEVMFIGAQTATITYYSNEEDANQGNNGITTPTTFVNTANPQTIYMRMKDNNTGCISVKSFQVIVNLLPDFQNPQNISIDLFECDDDGTADGFTQFNLTRHAAMLTGGDTTLQITYYDSLSGAQNGIGNITTPDVYTNTSNPQTIYMRLLDTTTNCFSTESFDITVRPEPLFNNPSNISLDLVMCDDITPDGFTAFDLTQHAAMLVGTQPDTAITYYRTQGEADSATNPITTPTAFSNTQNPQTIYMRITDSATLCYKTGTFQVSVNPLPVYNNPLNISLDLIKCDTDGTNDGINVFNLAQHRTMLINGQDVTLTYHESAATATAIGNVTSYINTASPQTIFMRMQDNVTGCEAVQSFTIRADMLPVFQNPAGINTNLEACDTDGNDDGFFAFDLTTHEPMFTNGQTNLEIKYYETSQQAANGTGHIPDPLAYTNTANPQTIYMRMLNTDTGCVSTSSFNIKVKPLPVFNNPANISLDMRSCDTDGVNDGSFTFDLTLHKIMLIGGQGNVDITYHTSATDAETGNSPIPAPTAFSNTINPQVIFMRIFNSFTGCHRVLPFTLKVDLLPLFLNPNNVSLDLHACDTDGIIDDTFTFNLLTNAAMLKGSQQNMLLTCHTSPADAETGNFPITNTLTHTNTANPQTIYLRMLNTATGCYSTTSFKLWVHKPPVFNNPLNISLDITECDTDGVADQKFVFDLTRHRALLTGSQSNVTVTYHETFAFAQAGTNAIAIPTAYTNHASPQTIFMRMTNQLTSCFTTKTFVIRVNPVPVFNNPQNVTLKLESCDRDNVDDQSYIFNLTTHTGMFVGSQTGMAITYHTTAADAASGLNFITNPVTFRNTTNPQKVFVRMRNIVTGCVAVTTFDIEVVELLNAGEPDDLSLCDTNGDGLQVFNLAQNTPLLQDGNTATFVRYYRTEADAQNQVNPLPFLYQNLAPYTSEIIWARLQNIGGCIGHDIKSFTISVLEIPEINFTVSLRDFTDHDNSITINIANPENYEFSLDGDAYFDSPIFTGLLPGLYKVYIRARNNCKTVDREVVILNYPKFFTPNGDSFNEYWQVEYLFLQPKSRVTIFDRYGKLITGFNGNSQGWDGTYNNRSLPATDYWFVLELQDGRVIKGHFAMIR